MEEEIERQRAANQAANKENSKLRAAIADRQFEAEQLDKQIRKLERKIDVLEDACRKSGGSSSSGSTVKRGFFKPVAANSQSFSPPERQPPAARKPEKSDVEKAMAEGRGIVIDGKTGKEMLEEAEEEEEKNPLLKRRRSPEEQLMQEMQDPISVNPDFNAKTYAKLLSEGKDQQATALMRNESGPTISQMERAPLAVLEANPGLDPNWCDPKYHGCSLAQWAASMGFNEVLRLLLQRRADPNHRSAGGVSCLATATAHSNFPCTQLLLEHRADPDERVSDRGRQTLLMWSSRQEYADQDMNSQANPFVQLLLDYRADPGLLDDRGKTALIHASTEGNVQAVEALLKARADVDVQDKDGSTALQIALRYYHGKISALLVPLRKRTERPGGSEAK
mmetsp:Transcript_39678/g.71226  ORF Transcript_39678/g.71226 Transcript_39678/m.71226 type:complete len:394 (+) Transcript_39678:72-1253(+)